MFVGGTSSLLVFLVYYFCIVECSHQDPVIDHTVRFSALKFRNVFVSRSPTIYQEPVNHIRPTLSKAKVESDTPIQGTDEFLMVATFSDNICTQMLTANAIRLNTCAPSEDGKYLLATCTKGDYGYSCYAYIYADSACKESLYSYASQSWAATNPRDDLCRGIAVAQLSVLTSEAKNGLTVRYRQICYQ